MVGHLVEHGPVDGDIECRIKHAGQNDGEPGDIERTGQTHPGKQYQGRRAGMGEQGFCHGQAASPAFREPSPGGYGEQYAQTPDGGKAHGHTIPDYKYVPEIHHIDRVKPHNTRKG
ncbi:MAG: hypothetical protein BWX80_04224 [Candidatus Hydrogenedentes bacterium ADurb.Bin101]|nr:MAG: hypothetical protein BWX80_04224 [Candidatus Hydrogenedentes bacterium ADurb.Bin101]